LLVDWAAQVGSRARVAWLSLDRADNDPTRFWRHVLAALDAQHAGIAHRTQRALRGGAQRAEVLVDELVADLSELNTDVVLVLDDYHLIESAQIHDGIGALLRRAPPLLHVLLSSRQDPPLALARRRAAAELIELRAADLRFSEVEAAGLLRAVIGQDLGSAQVEAIAARTEGWAAGLQLVALSLRDVATVDAAIRRFSGSDQFVIDYFLEEVLSQLSDETRRFLVGTSVLTRLSPALCDAVLGTSNGAAILDDLERKSMFVAPIDPDHEWFRYHALFAEVLHHVLRREAPETEPDLHLRAINWYVANGFVEDAIEQALAGSNCDRAAELLAGYVPALIQRGEEATVGRLLAALPSDILQRHPVLSPIRAAALMQLGEVAAAVTFMTAAERIFAELQLSSPLGAMLSLHATAAVVSEQGPAMAYAEQAFGLLQPHDPPEYRLLALNAMARAHLQAGAPDSAARVLEQAARLMSEVSAPISSLHMHHHLGHLRLMEGRLRAAGAQFESLLTLAADRPVFARYQALVCLAAVAYERNHLDSAATFLDHAAAARREAGRLAELPFFWLLRARIARARGQLSAAFAALERSEAAAVRFGQVRLQRHARAELTRLALDGHDLETALRWAGELELSGEDLNEFARELELLMRARVWLAAGRAGEAVPLLVNALARAEHAGRGASVMAISALLAQALMRLGQEDEARERFEAALVLGEPEGYVRVFVDEGAPLRVLLRSIPKQHALADYAAGLLLALSGARREIPEVDDPGPLTKREREVLELLAEGLSNRAMAVQLVASEATIKSHVHHLIAKLGVSTRAQAVVRARQQGLLG
jgi:LuxR family maltose regulon positive regulatory protein